MAVPIVEAATPVGAMPLRGCMADKPPCRESTEFDLLGGLLEEDGAFVHPVPLYGADNGGEYEAHCVGAADTGTT